jgi:hypothetical protein
MAADQILSAASVSDDLAPGGPAPARVRIVVAVRRGLLLLVVLAVGYTLVSQWGVVSTTLSAISWPAIGFSEAALILGMLASTYGWQIVLDDLGPRVGIARGGQIVLVGALGKYVPGSVWAYVLQMELGRRAGVQRARILTTSIVQVAVSVVASLLLGILALPLVLKHSPEAVWLFALLPFGLASLHPRILTWLVSTGLRLVKQPGLVRPLSYATVGKTFLCALLSYGLFGVHLWLLAQSQGDAAFSGLLLCIGAIAVGLTAGLFAFILPSGVGVREAVVAAALSSVMSPAKAVAFAIASRLLFTVGDVVTAGGAALLDWTALRIRRFTEARQEHIVGKNVFVDEAS